MLKNEVSMKRILLVEDESISARIQTNILEKCGYQVTTVPSGEKALNEIKNNEELPDLILMDIMLGNGMDGMQTANVILKDYDIPIVFLSSHKEKKIFEKIRNIPNYGYIIKGSGDAFLLFSIEMAFDRFNVNKDTRIRQDRLSLELDKSPDLIFITDKEGNIKNINKSARLNFGYANDEIKNLNISDILASNSVEEWESSLNRLKNEGKTTGEISIHRKDGSKDNYYFEAIRINSDEYIAFCNLNIEKTLSENKWTGINKRDFETDYRTIVESANEGIWTADKNSTIFFANEHMAKILGFRQDELIGRNFASLIHDNEQEEHKRRMTKLINGSKESYERLFLHKEGMEIHTKLSTVPKYDADGEFAGYFGIMTDITVIKQTENDLRKKLEEKEFILKEVHHRVNNNMQLINCFLTLGSRYIEDEKALQMLRESQGRIKSMQIIYRQLYKSQDISRINLNQYLTDLILKIFSTYNTLGDKIVIETMIEDLPLDISKIIPLGLIINELLTNALKHAFIDGRSGKISISLNSIDENEAVLIVKDNGIGIPEGIDTSGSYGLGLRLLMMMSEQIDGKYFLDNDEGTRFTIKFNQSSEFNS